MTEQEAISGAVLNTPGPDRFVDCGESRPLPMFHMATLMQYGEQCADAALAWLRSQGEPVAWRVISREGTTRCILEREPLREQFDLGETFVPLFLAPQPAIPDGWQNIETAPSDELVVVFWLDKDDTDHPERYDFDWLEDGCWMQHADNYDHFCCAAPAGSTGPSADAPYTHWKTLGKSEPSK